jgi:hypothetical protein
MPGSKELKRDKLYLCDIEYEFEMDNGEKGTVKEKLIGYVNGTEECFFSGSVYQKENNRYFGGDTVSLDVKQFNDWVKSIKEIA